MAEAESAYFIDEVSFIYNELQVIILWLLWIKSSSLHEFDWIMLCTNNGLDIGI